MEAFETAFVDPWESVDIGYHFYIVIMRGKDGQAFHALARTNQGEEHAIKEAMVGLNLQFLKNLKDANVIKLDDMSRFEVEEVMGWVRDAMS